MFVENLLFDILHAFVQTLSIIVNSLDANQLLVILVVVVNIVLSTEKSFSLEIIVEPMHLFCANAATKEVTTM